LKTILFFFILFINLLPNAYCQSVWVKENELIQILDKFILLQDAPSDIIEYDCVVRLNKESESHLYSIAITSIGYKEDIPLDSLYYIKHKNVNFYIIKNQEVLITDAVYEKVPIIIKQSKEARKISDPFTIEDVAIYSPIIRVFKIGKENRLFKNRLVYFETYNPINTISKMYWPVEKPMNAWTDSDILLFDKKTRKRIYPNSEYVEKGKGKFRISTN
jgi:hypothetical protein